MTKTNTVSRAALTFAAALDLTDSKLDVALASNSREQNFALFGEGARDLGATAAKIEGKIATLAAILTHVVDVDDKGVVNATQREEARVAFVREVALGWMIAGNARTGRAPVAEADARKHLEDMTETGKKARANAQTVWSRALTAAELRDPETDEQKAKREEAAAKKAATKADKAKSAAADKAKDVTPAATETAAPETATPAAPALSGEILPPNSPLDAIKSALGALTPDAFLACVSDAMDLQAHKGQASLVTRAAFGNITAAIVTWRRDRTEEIKQADLTACQPKAPAPVSIADLRAQLARMEAEEKLAAAAKQDALAKADAAATKTGKARAARGK